MSKTKIVVQKKVLFYYLTFVGGNGEPLLTSETYYSKSNALRAATTLSDDLGLKVVVK
jgi:uncharacterized protein YegP (UPF0339 family)